MKYLIIGCVDESQENVILNLIYNFRGTLHVRCDNSFQILSIFHTSEIWVPCVVVAFTFACINAGK